MEWQPNNESPWMTNHDKLIHYWDRPATKENIYFQYSATWKAFLGLYIKSRRIPAIEKGWDHENWGEAEPEHFPRVCREIQVEFRRQGYEAVRPTLEFSLPWVNGNALMGFLHQMIWFSLFLKQHSFDHTLVCYTCHFFSESTFLASCMIHCHTSFNYLIYPYPLYTQIL